MARSLFCVREGAEGSTNNDDAVLEVRASCVTLLLSYVKKISDDITSCFVFFMRGVKMKLVFVCTLNTSTSPSYVRFTAVSVHGRPVAVCGRKDLFFVLLMS